VCSLRLAVLAFVVSHRFLVALGWPLFVGVCVLCFLSACCCLFVGRVRACVCTWVRVSVCVCVCVCVSVLRFVGRWLCAGGSLFVVLGRAAQFSFAPSLSLPLAVELLACDLLVDVLCLLLVC